MKNKILVATLALVLVFGLTACGSDDKQTQAPTTTAPTTTTEATAPTTEAVTEPKSRICGRIRC